MRGRVRVEGEDVEEGVGVGVGVVWAGDVNRFHPDW